MITDIYLSDSSGNVVAEQIRKSDNPGVPIIGISCTPWESFGDHFDTILQKPFPLSKLVSVVEALLSDSGEISANEECSGD